MSTRKELFAITSFCIHFPYGKAIVQEVMYVEER